MVYWKVVLTNDSGWLSTDDITEFNINNLLENPNNYTPWVLLEEYCKQHGFKVANIKLIDTKSGIELMTPGVNIGTMVWDSIDFRRKIIGNNIGTDLSPMEYYGIIIRKDNVNLGVWLNEKTKEITTSIENY